MPTSRQLILPIFRGPRFAVADFRDAPSNADARTWLRRTTEWPNRRLALWGQAGCGKTHLLHAWVHEVGGVLLDGANLPDLAALPASGMAIDNADQASDERSLLHLLNAAGEAGLAVLLAARAPPARWRTRLPDLASRLRAITAVEIGPPEDALLRPLLSRLLADRQLRLPEPVQEWLVLRLPRSAGAFREAVERLDILALDQRRRITVPFAAAVLADMLARDESSGTDEISGTADQPSQDGEALL